MRARWTRLSIESRCLLYEKRKFLFSQGTWKKKKKRFSNFTVRLKSDWTEEMEKVEKEGKRCKAFEKLKTFQLGVRLCEFLPFILNVSTLLLVLVLNPFSPPPPPSLLPPPLYTPRHTYPSFTFFPLFFFSLSLSQTVFILFAFSFYLSFRAERNFQEN